MLVGAVDFGYSGWWAEGGCRAGRLGLSTGVAAGRRRPVSECPFSTRRFCLGQFAFRSSRRQEFEVRPLHSLRSSSSSFFDDVDLGSPRQSCPLHEDLAVVADVAVLQSIVYTFRRVKTAGRCVPSKSPFLRYICR